MGSQISYLVGRPFSLLSSNLTPEMQFFHHQIFVFRQRFVDEWKEKHLRKKLSGVTVPVLSESSPKTPEHL